MADIDVREGLLSGAYQIRDEQNMNGNTAARVGQMFVDIINAMTLMGGGGGIDPDTLKEILSKIDFSAYLKIEDARKIYLTIQDAIRTYLSKEEARLVYLTIEDAANTYLSKVAPDTAKELITFLKGIAIADGTYGIDSDGKGTFADVSSKTFHSPIFDNDINIGKGWGVDEMGNMQVESLEVRSYLKVLELIYNRLSAQGGDFVFTEAGTIDKTELQDDGRYLCHVRKDYDADFISFKEHDVLRGVVNNLRTKGLYYTCWMRVDEVDTADNTMLVSVYGFVVYEEDGQSVKYYDAPVYVKAEIGEKADSEGYLLDSNNERIPNNAGVPSGKNYPPTDSMVVHRWGNVINKDRQSCWYLSSYEKRIVMLDGVTKPIIDESNYAAFFGLPFELSSFKGHTMNKEQPYLYVRGAFLQDVHYIDYKGQVIKNERYRGIWSAEVAIGKDPYVVTSNTFDTVYHNNCKWQCVATIAKDEPTEQSLEWVLLQEAVVGGTTTMYQLVPSPPSIIKDEDGKYSASQVVCNVVKATGSDRNLVNQSNVFYSVNSNAFSRGYKVNIIPEDDIRTIEFILVEGDGSLYDSSQYDKNGYANILARVVVLVSYDGKSVYNTEVVAIGGSNVIRNGQGQLKLRAYIYRGDEDVSALIPKSWISWERICTNDEFDIEWNNRHKGVGRDITITPEDINQSALIECVINNLK